jgi:amidophosphoribosyltransferase
VALGGKFLIGVRDHQGLRPLELGAIEQDGEIIAYVLVSETCGLDIMGARYIREVQPGEILLIDENLNIHSTFLSNINPKLCLFELIYFARPDSIMKGIQVNEYREELGRILALNSPVPDADVVVGVPDSGTPAAIGFSKQSGIPFVQGLIKNRYVGRTFIQPTQSIRQLGIKLKLNPLPNVIRGKSVVLVDDSIVRGNTPGQLVKLLKQAGAKEVHLRISSPPIMWGCFYGIAMKSDELIARRLEGQIDRIKNEVGADSLAYLNLANALKVTNRNQKEFCTACFNGDYPVFVSDQSAEKENPHVSNSHLSESESTQAVLI